MALEGLHHITAITADAPRNVDFYARVLGPAAGQEDRQLRRARRLPPLLRRRARHARLDPDLLRVPRRRAAARPATAWSTRIQWRVASEDALAFWEARLADADVAAERTEDGAVAFADFEGLRHELLAVAVDDAPLAAHAADIPAEHALLGFHGVRAYASRPDAQHARCSRRSASATRAAPTGPCAASERHAALRYDAPPAERGVRAPGTVHHVAWSAADDAELEAVRAQAVAAPAPARRRSSTASTSTPSTSASPAACSSSWPAATSASTYDEPLESLGEALKLPPQYERLREQLEQRADPADQPARRGRRHDRARPRRSARPRASPRARSCSCTAAAPTSTTSLPFLDLLDPKRRLVGVTPGGPLFLPPGGRHWYVGAARRLPRPGHVFRASYELLAARRPRAHRRPVGAHGPRRLLAGHASWPTRSGCGAGRPRPAGDPRA